MRINVVTGPLLPVPPVAGGSVHRMWWGLARQFAAAGHEVTVLARRWSGMAAEETVDGFRVLRRGGFDASAWRPWNLARDLVYAVALKHRIPAADVTVVNDLSLPALLRRGGDHGMLVINANRYPKGQYRYYRNVDLIACASQAIAAAVTEEAPAMAPRTQVIPNALDVERFRPAPATSRGPIVLYVGRIDPEKGLEVLIDAFSPVVAAVPRARLWLVGPSAQREGGGGEAYLKRLKTRAAGLPVEFPGPEFDLDKLARAYAEAAVFCYPTRAETGEALPVAPLEAMAAGCPVVLSALSCFEDYAVTDHNALKFDHRSSEAPRLLADQLLCLLTDAALAERLRLAGLKTVERYDYPAVAGHYLDAFSDLVGG